MTILIPRVTEKPHTPVRVLAVTGKNLCPFVPPGSPRMGASPRSKQLSSLEDARTQARQAHTARASTSFPRSRRSPRSNGGFEARAEFLASLGPLRRPQSVPRPLSPPSVLPPRAQTSDGQKEASRRRRADDSDRAEFFEEWKQHFKPFEDSSPWLFFPAHENKGDPHDLHSHHHQKWQVRALPHAGVSGQTLCHDKLA